MRVGSARASDRRLGPRGLCAPSGGDPGEEAGSEPGPWLRRALGAEDLGRATRQVAGQSWRRGPTRLRPLPDSGPGLRVSRVRPDGMLGGRRDWAGDLQPASGGVFSETARVTEL